MTIKKIIFIFILTLCIIPNCVFAFCPSSTLQEYKEYARNTNIKYSLINKDVLEGNYRLTFRNLNYNIYAKIKNTDITYKNEDEENENAIATNDAIYKGGSSITIDYYTIDGLCPNDVIYTVKLNIPKYNIYYDTDTCSGITNYEYCNEYVFTDMNYDELKNRIDEYRESHEIEKVIEEEDNLKDMLPIIIGGSIALVIIIVIICIIINKRKKKYDDWSV